MLCLRLAATNAKEKTHVAGFVMSVGAATEFVYFLIHVYLDLMIKSSHSVSLEDDTFYHT